MDGTLDDRGLELIGLPSRAIGRGEIHELISTDETGAVPGSRVDRIAYLGFWEIERGGVLIAGDTIWAGGRVLGIVAGYDLTHAPNHMNIVVKVASRLTGKALGLQLEDEVVAGANLVE
jgi:hypothetical protein